MKTKLRRLVTTVKLKYGNFTDESNGNGAKSRVGMKKKKRENKSYRHREKCSRSYVGQTLTKRPTRNISIETFINLFLYLFILSDLIREDEYDEVRAPQ